MVFPAYAGMFLFTPPISWDSAGFPRIRGDVPVIPHAAKSLGQFSPHTRGCSASEDDSNDDEAVFPAYAGMFLEDHLIGL